MRDGKKHGHWVEDFFDGMHGGRDEGPYVEGKKHGQWSHNFGGRMILEGPYENDRRHGRWVEREDALGIVEEGNYVLGQRQGRWTRRDRDGDEEVGLYVDGGRHGHWVMRHHDGRVEETSYVAGERHGPWVMRYPDGSVEEGSYVADDKHGRWVERNTAQGIEEGPYVEGLKHGRWIVRGADGRVDEGPYVENRRHGRWVTRFPDGNVEEGWYLEGGKHGRWVERDVGGSVQEGPYVNGRKHGRWVERDAGGAVEEGAYVEDERHGRWTRRYRDGNVEEGSFVEGDWAGDWIIYREPERNEYMDDDSVEGDAVNPLAPEMVVIPGGRFRMGCVSGMGCNDRNEAVHEVTVAPFALSRYEVTLAEYDRFTAATGRDRVSETVPRDSYGRRPVTGITWYDAVAYVEWLSARTGEPYRLPSEAEWEYAARAGTETLYGWGDDIGRDRANCDGCGSTWDGETPAPVGSFEANAWGLYDMHGNVWEVVQDCRHDDYERAPTDGSAWDDENCNFIFRVVRGGSWNSDPASLRSANRMFFYNGGSLESVGFRVARTIGP